MVSWDRTFLRTGQVGEEGKTYRVRNKQTPAFDDVAGWPVRVVFAFRLFYRARLRCLYQGLPRVTATATMTKSENGNSADKQDPGSWITDMFLVVMRWVMLVWDEIGRARASVSADASSRALVCSLASDTPYPGATCMHPDMEARVAGLDSRDTLLLGSRVQQVQKKKVEKAAQWAQGGESVSCMAAICSSKSMRAWHGRDYTFSKDASQFSGTREAMPGQQGWGSQRPRVDDLGAQGRRPDTAQNKNESVFLRFLAAF